MKIKIREKTNNKKRREELSAKQEKHAMQTWKIRMHCNNLWNSDSSCEYLHESLHLSASTEDSSFESCSKH